MKRFVSAFVALSLGAVLALSAVGCSCTQTCCKSCQTCCKEGASCCKEGASCCK